jgi:hypothetical protein
MDTEGIKKLKATKTPMQWLLEARKYRRKKDYLLAGVCYEFAELWKQAGRMFEKAEDWEAAERCYYKARMKEDSKRMDGNMNPKWRPYL